MLHTTIKNCIDRLEAMPLKLGHGIIAVLCLIYLRTVFEGILEPPHLIGFSASAVTGLTRFIHDALSYLVITLSIILIIWCCSATRVQLTTITRLALYILPLLLMPPIIDGLLTGGSGYDIRYQKSWDNFPTIFLHSFNPLVSLEGITPGQRVEVFFVCIAAAAYVGLKRLSPMYSILTFLASYSAICFYAFLPAMYVSLVTAFSEVIVPPGWSIADAVFVSPDEPSYMIDLRFSLIYLVIASLLIGTWWLITRYQKNKRLVTN